MSDSDKSQADGALDPALGEWRTRVFAVLGWSSGGPGRFDPPGSEDPETMRAVLGGSLAEAARQALATLPERTVAARVAEAKQALDADDFAKAAAMISLLSRDGAESGTAVDCGKLATAWRGARQSTETVIAAIHRAALDDHPELAEALAPLGRVPELFSLGLEETLDQAAVADGEARAALTRKAVEIAKTYRETLTGNPFFLHLERNPYIPVDAAGVLCGQLDRILGALA